MSDESVVHMQALKRKMEALERELESLKRDMEDISALQRNTRECIKR